VWGILAVEISQCRFLLSRILRRSASFTLRNNTEMFVMKSSVNHHRWPDALMVRIASG
jgi:hypothetical protein